MSTLLDMLLIAGTDRGVGKTILTTALAAYWQKFCGDRSLGILKPVQFGLGSRVSEQNDAAHFSQWFAEAADPRQSLLPIELEALWQQLDGWLQQRDFVLMEGWDGLGTPFAPESTLADLAWDWRLPTVLVVPVRPNAIGQAVSNVALARSARVHLKGIILNCVQPDSMAAIEDWMPRKLLESLTRVPVLGTMPHLADVNDRDRLIQAASNLDLERLMPIAPVLH